MTDKATKPKKITGMGAFARQPAEPATVDPTHGIAPPRRQTPYPGEAPIEASIRFLARDHRRLGELMLDMRAELGRKVSLQELVERGLSLLFEQRGLEPLEAVRQRDAPKPD